MPRQKKSKRAPWKARDLREARIISSKREKRYLRAQDLIKHNRYATNDTELIEIRDIQYDHADILTYQTAKEINPTSNTFLEGSAEDDDLQGRPGNDYINGKEGNDVIFGMEGNDYISGDSGIDTLTGGTGADYFELDLNPTPETINENRNDVITDFSLADADKIVLTTTAINSMGALSTMIAISTSPDATANAIKAGNIVIYENFSGRIIYSPDTRSQALLLATLFGSPNLSETDILLANTQ